ncbi:MAG: transcriptional repressor LexA [Clostridia bacterium]|nr:transcriptional repressor LexA [Clostridia bacterium]
MRTKNQELITKMINFIESEYQKNGLAPTLREIASEFNITSACVSHYLTEMKEKGLIQSNGKSRSIKTSKMQSMLNEVSYLPVVGSIACGTPLLAEENIEKYLPVPTDFLGAGKFFILRANGNSMIKAGIEDGDYVIVKQQETAEIGQIIVALINDEATLKRYYIDNEKQQVRLHPENDKMNDMYFKNVVIQGIAVKVIKDLT